MSEIRPYLQVLPGDRYVLTGTMQDVNTALAKAQASGRLVQHEKVHLGAAMYAVHWQLAPLSPRRTVVQPAQAKRHGPPMWVRWSLATLAVVFLVLFVYVVMTAPGLVLLLIGVGAVALLVLTHKPKGQTFSGTFHGRVH